MPSHELSALIARVNQGEADTLTLSGARADTPHITHMTIDSRQVGPGSLFVALRGAQTDGHRFIETAVERGASAVLVDADRAEDFASLSIPIIVATHTRAVLGDVARAFYEDPFSRLRAVIGITGTNGKTTSTYIAESLLERAGLHVGVIGTINYRWMGDVCIPAQNTTPESIVLYELAHRMAEAGVEVLLMEVSSHGLETHRLNGIACHAAVFTNFTQDHLDFHGSMDAYRAAKRRLFFEHLAPGGVAVLNLNDPVGESWARELLGEPALVRGFDFVEEIHVSDMEDVLSVVHVNASLNGSLVQLADVGELDVPLLGAFNVSNVLGVMLAIEGLGLMTRAQLTEAMPLVTAVPGRMQRVNPGGFPAVFVDYAHTPDALAHVLETLKPFTQGELCCVFGCGGDRDRGKRPVMGEVASERADRVLLTSDNPRSEPPMQIIDQIIKGTTSRSERVEVEPDRALAIRAAIINASEEDVILIAGKGHEPYQELASGRIDFDDVASALNALAMRRPA